MKYFVYFITLVLCFSCSSKKAVDKHNYIQNDQAYLDLIKAGLNTSTAKSYAPTAQDSIIPAAVNTKNPCRNNANQIYQNASKYTLVIAVEKNHQTHIGAGVLISNDGLFISSYELMGAFTQAKKIIALDYQQKTYQIKELLHADKENDLVIMKLDSDKKDFTAAHLSTFTPAGVKVYHLSHPNEHFYVFTEGMISREFMEDKNKRIAITNDLNIGSVGGPIINLYGEVCAIVTYSAKNSVSHKECIPFVCLNLPAEE